MGRIKYLLQLLVVLGIGLAGYAMVAELPPPTKAVSVDIAVPASPGQ